ncbi:hypothetical protein JCM10207_007983 [Rhodosporidiobolus poonsookiae]
MGVHGLWQLLGPCARPIQLETLSNKKLAIDASIWLYQFQMAMRDKKTGDTLAGAHIMGTFRRIVKLLFHGIKPVFVFDGDAPMLKKRTIEKRRRRKEGATRDLTKTAHELLAAQLRGLVAEKELSKRKPSKADKTVEVDTGDQIGPDAVYLDDLDKPRSPAKSVSPTKPRKDALRDEYALPKLDGPLETRVKASDPRIATEEELRDFIEDLRPEDLDINSPFFGNLPTEVKYEILGDLRIKTRQVNHRRVQQMREFGTAVDFSRAQIENLMERNLYTQRLLDVTDELGHSAIAIPTRVAGQRNREYILVKQDVEKGGGWVLGVKNPLVTNDEPITIDTTTDESVGTHTDTDEFEEVGAESPQKSVGLPTPDVEARRLLAVEAVRARVSGPTKAPAADPYLDQPVASTSRSGATLFGNGGAPPADEDDVALQRALFESAQNAAGEPQPAQQLPPLPHGMAMPTFDRNIFRLPKPPPVPSNGNFAAPQNGYDTDDSIEYVDIPPEPKKKPAAAPPAPQVELSDTDESDAFEEVAVRRSAQARSTGASAPAPSAPRPPSPLPARQSATPAPAEAARTIFNSVLPSDSEDEDDAPSSPAKPAPPLPAPPAHVAAPRPPPRLSLSPDPFEAFEASAPRQEGVTAKDFVLEDDPTFSSPPPVAPAPPAPAKARTPSPAAQANLPPALATMEVDSAHDASPADLPAPLPLSTKAQDAVEAEEAAVLPATLAQLPSPRRPISPSPPLPTRTASPAPSVPSRRPSPPLETPTIDRSPTLAVDDGDSDAAMEEVDVGTTPASPVPSSKGKEVATGGDESEEEVFFSDWSRSPSPPAGRRSSGEGLFLPEEEYDSDAEAEEAAKALQEEAAAYADVVAQLRNERLEKMRTEAEAEVERLKTQRNTEQRNADGISRQMAMDVKELLILFGIPYIDAPQEAEAECASLLSRDLVDGIVTDDSDVFLFGGSRIYRNMFNESKYVECYLLADLEREIGLDRDKLVRLAYLLGSDYTDGLPGVGPVQGMELLNEFPGEDGLKRFKQWWAKVQSGKDAAATDTTWKRRFRKGHKKLIIDDRWPDPEISNAYYRPTVQESDEAFSWAGTDLDGLRHYLARTLGWDQTKTDSTLLPLIKREQDRKEGKHKQQKQVTDFFDVSAGYKPFSRAKQPKYASKRLQNVVQTWKDKTQRQDGADKIEELDDDDEAEPSQASTSKKRKTAKPPAKAPRRKKSTVASRKRAAQEQRDARAAANDGVYSSEEDLDDAGPSTSKKRTQPARKKRKKAVVVQPSSEEDE